MRSVVTQNETQPDAPLKPNSPAKPEPCIVMAGGGTGGHVIPALAVARELRARGRHVRFIGTERGIEARLVPAEKFPLDWIVIGGLNRVGFKRAAQTLIELPLSIWQASRILDRTRAAAVFSLGGYVAGPVMLAALWKRLPIVVMAPDFVPGYTQRKLARFVARALVSFPETAEWFPKSKAEVTGLPVREEFFEIPDKAPGSPLTVLITGGSQGSRSLNVAAEESWPLWKTSSLAGRGVRFIHQTGMRTYAELEPKFEAAKKEHGIEGEMHPFLSEMPAVFAQADLVVSRSGMGAISELAAAGKPSILIPLPTAANQHQLKNAEAMQEAGGAKVVLDSEWNGQRFVDEVANLASKPAALVAMAKAARTFAKRGAAQRAADIMESFLPAATI